MQGAVIRALVRLVVERPVVLFATKSGKVGCAAQEQIQQEHIVICHGPCGHDLLLAVQAPTALDSKNRLKMLFS